MWTEKYRPRSVTEVVGNEGAKKKFLEWVRKWREGNVKELGVFFIGPQGVGKTSLVYAAANDLGFHVIELNASDVRTKERILAKLAPVVGSTTLERFFGGKGELAILFLDEVDGIYGTSDKGGIEAILEIAERREALIVLSANFPDSVKHKDLLKNFKQIRFSLLHPKQILIILKRIIKEENLNIDEEILNKIAVKSRGDARFAINALQLVASGYADVDSLGVNFTLPLQEAVNELIEVRDFRSALEVISRSLTRVNDLYIALADAVASSALDARKKAQILSGLSRVDVLMNVIRRRGMWRLLREGIYMLASLAAEIPPGRVRYSDRIRDYVFARAIYKLRADQLAEICDLLKRRLHCSRRKIVQDVLPYLVYMIKAGKHPGLSLDEVSVLTKALGGRGKREL